MKIRSIQFIIFLIPAIVLAGFVLGYDCMVIHPKLTRAAVEVYNRDGKERNINNKEKEWIVQGAIDEDMHPRYINHFYNPETGDGLYFLGAQASAKEWAQDQNSVTGNFDAKTILLDYENDNYERAFTGLGHLLHLIEDMSVPAHTRLDAHEEGDPFESWAHHNDPVVDMGNIDILRFNGLNQAFDQLASYSHFNFFSKDTMFYVKDREARSEKMEGKSGVYVVYCKDNFGTEFACARKIKKLNLDLYLIENEDFIVHQNYWRMLSPKAVGTAAGVIDMFMEEFARIDEKKLAERQDGLMELWGQEALYDVRSVLRGVKSLAGYLVDGGGDKVAEGVNVYKEFSAKQDSVFDVIKNSSKIITNKSLGVMNDLKESIDNIKVLGESMVVSDENTPSVVGVISSQESVKLEEGSVTSSLGVVDLEEGYESAKIDYIIDGDTFVMTDGDRVRLIGIDAPELGYGEREDECLAEWAKVRLENMLDSGELILVRDPGMEEDKYGRLLRYVYVDDLFVNEKLALEGLAEIFFCEPYFKNCPAPQDIKRKSMIIKAGESAEEEKRGIYSSFCLQNGSEMTSEHEKRSFVSYGGGGSSIVEKVENENIAENGAVNIAGAISCSATSTAHIGTSTMDMASTTTVEFGTSTPDISTSTLQTGTSTRGMTGTTSQVGTTTPVFATSTIEKASSTEQKTPPMSGATIRSVSGGGNWFATTTWENGELPVADDVVEINGEVVLNRGSVVYISGLRVSLGGILKNKITAHGILHINGSVENLGSIQNNENYYLYLKVSGDIINNGSWNNYRTYLISDNTRNVSGTGPIGANIVIDDDMEISGNPVFRGNFSLNENILTLPDPDQSITILGTIDGRGEIGGQGSLVMGDGSRFFGSDITAPRAVFTKGDQAIKGVLRAKDIIFAGPGTKEIVINTYFYGDLLIEEGVIVQNKDYKDAPLIIDGDVDNKGVIQDNVNLYLTMEVSGDIINDGVWNNYRVRLTSADQRSVSGTEPIGANVVIDDDMEISGSPVFMGNFSLNENILTLPDSDQSITILGTIDGRGEIGGKGSLVMGDGSRFFGSDITVSRAVFTKGDQAIKGVLRAKDIIFAGPGTKEIVINTYFYGDLLIEEGVIVHNREYINIPLTIDGNITNNGTIQDRDTLDGELYYLYVNIFGDILNNGIWNNRYTGVTWNEVLGVDNYEFNITDDVENWPTPITVYKNKYSVTDYINTKSHWRVRPVIDDLLENWNNVRTIN